MSAQTTAQSCKIISNTGIAKHTWRMEVACDTAGFAPGRFVNVAVPGFYLRRPLAICSWAEGRLVMVYRELGGGTRRLATLQPGDTVDVLCPLGNGFSLRQNSRVLLVGGGVGLAPLLCLAKALKAGGCEVHVACGFGTADEVYLYEEFSAIANSCTVATVDGSRGVKGLVTGAFPAKDFDFFYACGPLPMLKAVEETLPCPGEVSTEERMACGFGGCMGCSIQTKSGMKRVCKDGPVFAKGELIW